MYQQSVMPGWNQGQWNAPGAGSSGVSSWSGGAVSSGNSMVSQYDSQQQRQQQHYPNQYYQQQQQQQQPTQQQPSSSLSSSNVTLYTQYYHAWKVVADSPSSTQDQKQWATYYSDLSSRAAHYYHQNPNTTQPPSQELPPAPPSGATPAPAEPVQPMASVASNQKPVDEKSFQVYVDKCLQNCKSIREKEIMVQKTKTVLQNAIRNGNLHTKDWSREPLLSAALYQQPPAAVYQQPSPTPPQVTSPAGVNYYEPNSSLADHRVPTIKPFVVKNNSTSSKKNPKAPMPKKRSYPETPVIQDSYYGPSASSLSVSPTGSQKRTKTSINGFKVTDDTLSKRAQRFASSFQQTGSFDLEEVTQEGPVIVGTCQVLEKEYLRLTSAPKPELVRPQPILEKHFGNLKKEYENLKHRRDYMWFCSQLKAMRQDCTVQHLKNEFCVHVYEFHAKVALEQNDFNEFNQCQTQLKYLYPSLKDTVSFPNRAEFISYRILYAVYLNLHSEKSTIDMKEILGHEEKTNDACVTHALAVLSAAQEMNYHAFFFKLYPSQHGHQNYFLEKIAPIIRKRALETMCTAYRPTLEVDYVREVLKISDGVSWLEQVGCVLESVSMESGEECIVIKTKETVIKEPESIATTSKLM